MAHTPSREEAAQALLADFSGWHLSIACPACRLLVQLRCADIDRTLPGLTVGDVAGRRVELLDVSAAGNASSRLG